MLDEELFARAVTVTQLRKALGCTCQAGPLGDLPVTAVTAEGDEVAVTSAAPWVNVDMGPYGNADDVRAKLASGELQPDHFEIGLDDD